MAGQPNCYPSDREGEKHTVTTMLAGSDSHGES